MTGSRKKRMTREEIRTGLELARMRGRLPGSIKESTMVRFDRDVLDACRAGGPGASKHRDQRA